MSNEFNKFCASEGIRKEVISPHNPQQNGVLERKNISIVGARQAMLHDQGLTLHLCVEACNTMVYVKKKIPHQILGMSTPVEYFSGKNLDVAHFNISGSSVYCHLSKDERKNIEPTIELGIFLGYTDTPHNY